LAAGYRGVVEVDAVVDVELAVVVERDADVVEAVDARAS